MLGNNNLSYTNDIEAFCWQIKIRDGPFKIQGGWDFSSRQVIFSLFFAQQNIFFKSKLQQVFYFFEKKTL